jgi:phosphonate transport system ATP-binding protein
VIFSLNNENLGYDGCAVLRDISVTISAGERVALVGESGSGKTTLLSVLQTRYDENTALIPQNLGLVRSLSVFHNIYMGALARNNTAYNLSNLVWPRKREVAQIRPIAEGLGLGDKLFERVGTLSGGQQQRVAICRALFQGGEAVLGDEPVSAIDNHQSRIVLDALTENFETVILAMHDVDLALEYSTRIVGIKNGGIALDEPTGNLTRPDLDFLYTD